MYRRPLKTDRAPRGFYPYYIKHHIDQCSFVIAFRQPNMRFGHLIQIIAHEC